jgi:N-methylhydantoinase A
MYTLNYRPPPPLVPRRLRLEVDERMAADGGVRIPLDPDSVAAAAERLAAAGVNAVAVSLIHAYANPEHERRVAEILRARLGDRVFVTCSSDILPVIREYERTSTTVINAFLGPALRDYFASLRRHLATIGVTAPIHVMKSDGGVMTLAAAEERPAALVESGPAAGVIGAAASLRGRSPADAITFDMGGTTAKVSLIENGESTRTGDYEVGAGINLSSKLVMGGGYALKLPVIDISEVGAGGGSLVAIDAGGLLRVGPQSAGALPGPVCYDRGGAQATFTDAALTLGYISPRALAGGGLKLNAAAGRAAVAAQVGRPLGRDPLDAAYGVFQVACGTMVRAVKAVSTYRGRDPRDFALYAFGGNGPVVAAAIADFLEMKRVVVPPHPGVFSAYGLMSARIEHEAARAFLARLADIAPADLAARLDALEAEVRARLAAEGFPAEQLAVRRLADLRYAGQAHELTVPLAAGPPDFAAMARDFGAEHERTYGHQAECEEVECVTLRVVARIDEAAPASPPAPAPRRAAERRLAFFGGPEGRRDVPILGRGDLAEPRRGPLIVEEYDATCVVPPGWSASLDATGNIVLAKD